MSITSGRRRELIAIVALLVGVFIGLAMQPWWDVTGPLGRSVGRILPKYFGVGAVMIAMLGIFVGLAGFGRFRGLGLRRASVLIAGLVLLLPFAIAIAIAFIIIGSIGIILSVRLVVVVTLFAEAE